MARKWPENEKSPATRTTEPSRERWKLRKVSFAVGWLRWVHSPRSDRLAPGEPCNALDEDNQTTCVVRRTITDEIPVSFALRITIEEAE